MTKLEEKIKHEIRKNGYISIDRFMEISLFDQEYGYYIAKNPIGKDSDFITSPEISVLFGEIIGLFITNQIKEKLSSYDKINLIELGAGKGTLINDILNLISKFPDTYQKINIHILEINPVLVEIQQKTLINHIDKIRWIENISITDNNPHIYIANEFFDALPVKQFIKEPFGFSEKVIKLESESLVFDKIPTSAVPELISNESEDYDENSIIEYSEASMGFMQQISENILKHKGFALIIDYGYIDFLSGDSLQSVKNHKHNNIFENIGDADLTSHVNFRLLYQVALEKGIQDIYLYNQAEFLDLMGIGLRAEIISKKLKEDEKKDLFVRISRLINPEGMGTLFKCMVIEKF